MEVKRIGNVLVVVGGLNQRRTLDFSGVAEKLVLAIGVYEALGKLMNVLDIDLEATMGTGSATSLIDDYKEG